jgi:nucleoside-diphosphate-sugar epimerase
MKISVNKKHIAILGATSHVAKGLIAGFLGSGYTGLTLFARSAPKVHAFLEAAGSYPGVPVRPFAEFSGGDFDVVINCVGIGDPGKLRLETGTIFSITESFDNLVLQYLEGHPDCLYVNFSSGAAYGQDFSQPVSERSPARYEINGLTAGDYYGIAKAYSEAKHRALTDRHIVDLRIFGYFSKYIDLGMKYLMCEVVSCLKSGAEFVTGPGDIVRDYVHPEDLLALVAKCIALRELNRVYDVYSLRPVGKFEMLESFAAHFGLKYRVEGDFTPVTATGNKDHYYSLNKKAQQAGYQPGYDSLRCLIEETRHLLA